MRDDSEVKDSMYKKFSESNETVEKDYNAPHR